ncbi:hypothetical protein P43SY_011095 [Pythium insidiosum]|uniref:Uncharacterized protein n=1 Tax=Pythium insidiosum TaxID=114742 RepID=A0AAD5L849_PYTIN|nr:hypothetical protein P43SY_011095 [Pythium insidiosum]
MLVRPSHFVRLGSAGLGSKLGSLETTDGKIRGSTSGQSMTHETGSHVDLEPGLCRRKWPVLQADVRVRA